MPTRSKKRILLVSPRDFATTYGDLRHIAHLTGNNGRLLNVALPTLAALTPREEVELTIVDENVEPLDFSQRYDLVGITGFPPQLARAREIGRGFRARGSLIVCGGTSATLSPTRWRDVADVLVLGEAERIWPRFLADWLAGTHCDEYRETERPDLSLTPIPDYAPMSPAAIRRFGGGIVQTSRGCPFDCEFCDAIVFAGRKIRYKPIDAILTEIDQLDALGLRYVYLADDNFGAGRKKSKEILRALADYNRRRPRPVPLLTQLSVDLADDEEFLELAAEAGLTRVFIGLETPNLESLAETHKLQNVRTDMFAAVRRFHEHGIEVLGGSMLGFDADDLGIFRRQLEFFTRLGVASVQVYPLNAPDGTPLKERMKREGRYMDWESSDSARSKHFSYFSSYTIVPKQMSVNQLRQGLMWLLWQLYDWDAFVDRFASFLAQYRASSKRDRLHIPTGAHRLTPSAAVRVLLHNREALVLMARVAAHCARSPDPKERSTLLRLLRLARGSSHPQRWSLAVSSFLTLVNTRRMLLEQAPDIADATYPTTQDDGDCDATLPAPPSFDVSASSLLARKP